jgi:hypothetical protein
LPIQIGTTVVADLRAPIAWTELDGVTNGLGEVPVRTPPETVGVQLHGLSREIGNSPRGINVWTINNVPWHPIYFALAPTFINLFLGN